jgi:hypothetical protein
VCLLFSFRTVGCADDNIEIVQKKGLLLLQGYDHWLDTNYQFTDNHSSGATSTSQTVTETYNFTATAALMDQRVFEFTLGGSLGLQQVFNDLNSTGSSYGSGSIYQYSFSGTAFEESRFPLIVQSSRTLNTVTPPYSPTYTTDTTTNAAELTLLHDVLPLKFRYERDATTLESGGSTSNSTSNNYSITATHKIRDFSQTSLSLSMTNAEDSSNANTASTNNLNSNRFSASLSNSLFMGTSRNHTLQTSLQWIEENPSGVQQQLATVGSTLLSRFGKALDTQIAYQGNFTRTTDVTGDIQYESSNSITASMHHHLFNNLDTRLRVLYLQDLILGGEESRYSGLAGVNYHKLLPAASRFSFDISGEHAVIDRNVVSTILTIRNEQHTVTLQGESIPVNNTEGSLLSVVSVTSVNMGITTLYVAGVDYTVDTSPGGIVITPGGAISPGMLILVTYTVNYAPSLKYATDTVTLGSSLSLLEGKYLLSGTLMNQVESLLSGQSQNSLLNTRVGQLRFKGFLPPDQNYTFTYEDFDSTNSSYQFFEGLWQYKHLFSRTSLSLQAREHYEIYDPQGLLPGHDQLTSDASLALSRPVLQFMQMTLMLDMSDIRDNKQGNTDLLFFRSNLSARFNKLTITLNGQSSWRFFGSSLNRDDYVRLDVVRYF